MLYRQEGLVQTQALYSMEAPWLPKSESGTRSPSLHLRHRGNAFSTKSPPSFSLEDSIHPLCYMTSLSEEVSRGGASAAASASPQQVNPCCRYHTIKSVLCQHSLWRIFHHSSSVCFSLPFFQSLSIYGNTLALSIEEYVKCIHTSCLHLPTPYMPSITGATNSVKHIAPLFYMYQYHYCLIA